MRPISKEEAEDLLWIDDNEKQHYGRLPPTISQKDRSYLHGIKNRYGITPSEYLTLLQGQRSRCAICLKKPLLGKRLQIDHDHKTGRVRGLLCGNCNIKLAQIESWISEVSPERVIEYITA